MAQTFKILVPTDFSECAHNALKTACSIAQNIPSEIFLLHVLDYSGYVLALDSSLLNSISLNDMYTEMQENSKLKLKELQEQFENEDLIITSVTESGIPTDEIHQFEKKICH